MSVEDEVEELKHRVEALKQLVPLNPKGSLREEIRVREGL
jgi:hypothetical protein